MKRKTPLIQRHPWLILAAGAAVQLLTGIPSAWGAFQQPVTAQYALTAAAAEWAFSLLVASYGLGCVLGGFLQDRHGPRAAALAGTVLLCGGFGAAAVLPAGRPGLFYAAFSVPAGLGSAFLAPSVLACAQKWYAGRKGLATGAVGLATGLSGALLTWLVRRFTTGGGQLFGLDGARAAFGALALVCLPVCLAGSLLLADPPPPKPRPEQQGRQYQQPGVDYAPRRMLRTRQYWLCAAAAAFSTPAVLLFSPVVVQLAQQRGLPEAAALWAVVLGSVGTAAGRLLAPLVSDRIGRRRTDLWLFAALLGLSAGLWAAQGWWVVVCYALLCGCYAGIAAVLPALATDLFGLPHAGVNYGFLALGQSAGSLAFPLLARALEGALPPALAGALGPDAARHLLAVAGAALGWAAMRRLRPTKGGRV